MQSRDIGPRNRWLRNTIFLEQYGNSDLDILLNGKAEEHDITKKLEILLQGTLIDNIGGQYIALA